jgi:hypothetical protein
MMTVAVGAALASAAGFAYSTSAQHHAAESAPASARGSVGLLRHLLTTPLWLVAAAIGIFAFTMHAVALHSGAIAVVQPIIVSGVVLAVPVKAVFNHKRPTRAEMFAVTLTAVGLGVFLVVARPSSGGVPDATLALLLTVTGFGGAALLIYGAANVAHAARRAMLLGCAGGVLFGLVAGLLKITTNELTEHGLVGLLSSWTTWLLIVAGLGGVTLNQRAYQIAPLSASMPALNAVNVVVALGFGLAVFGETPAHDPLSLSLQLVALVTIIAGLRLLAGCEDEPVVSAKAPLAA